jgi:hypothetical protein
VKKSLKKSFTQELSPRGKTLYRYLLLAFFAAVCSFVGIFLPPLDFLDAILWLLLFMSVVAAALTGVLLGKEVLDLAKENDGGLQRAAVTATVPLEMHGKPVVRGDAALPTVREEKEEKQKPQPKKILRRGKISTLKDEGHTFIAEPEQRYFPEDSEAAPSFIPPSQVIPETYSPEEDLGEVEDFALPDVQRIEDFSHRLTEITEEPEATYSELEPMATPVINQMTAEDIEDSHRLKANGEWFKKMVKELADEEGWRDVT